MGLLEMESYEYGTGEMDRSEELLKVLTFGVLGVAEEPFHRHGHGHGIS